MNLYGQARLSKTLNDQKNIERNYWRIFRELEEAKKTVGKLEIENAALTEEVTALKVEKPTKKAIKKPAKKATVAPVVEDSSDED